jgi:hypothetical protein
MFDGMESERMSLGQLDVGSVIATVTLSGVGLAVSTQEVGQNEIGSAVIGTANLATSAVTAAKEGFVGYGSPLTYGMRLEVGSSAMTAATSLWVLLSANFSKPPYVLNSDNSAGGAVGIALVAPGSFMASGTNATIFHWAAIGPA